MGTKMSESFNSFYPQNQEFLREILRKSLSEDEALLEGNLLYLITEGDLDQPDVEALRTSTTKLKEYLVNILKVEALSTKLPSAAAWYQAQGRNIQAAEKFVMKLDLNKPKGAKDWVKSVFGKGFTVANGVAAVALIDTQAAGGLKALGEATALVQRNLEGKLADEIKLVDVPAETGLTKEDIASGIKKAFDKSMGNEELKDSQGLMKKLGGKAAKIPGVTLSEFPLENVMPEIMELTLPELASLVEALNSVPTPDDGAVDDAMSNANNEDSTGGTEEEADTNLTADEIGKAGQAWLDKLKSDGADAGLLKLGQQWMAAVSKDPDFKKIAGLSESYRSSLSFLLLEQVKWPDLVGVFGKHAPGPLKGLGADAIEPLIAPFAQALVDQGIEVVDKSGNPIKPPTGETDEAIEDLEDEAEGAEELDPEDVSQVLSKKEILAKAKEISGEAGSIIVSKLLDSDIFKNLNITIEESLRYKNLGALTEASVSAEDYQAIVGAAMEENEEVFKDVDTSGLVQKINQVFSDQAIDLEIEEALPKWDDLDATAKRRSQLGFWLDGKYFYGGPPSLDTFEVLLGASDRAGYEQDDLKDMDVDFNNTYTDQKGDGAPKLADVPEFVDLVNKAAEKSEEYAKYKIGGDEQPEEEEEEGGEEESATNSIKTSEFSGKIASAIDDVYGNDEELLDLIGADGQDKEVPTVLAKVSQELFGDDFQLEENYFRKSLSGLLFEGQYSWVDVQKTIDKHAGDISTDLLYAVFAKAIPSFKELGVEVSGVPEPDLEALKTALSGEEEAVDPNAELDIEDPAGITDEEQKKLDDEAKKAAGTLGKIPIDKNKLAAILKKHPDIVSQGQKATRARRKLRKAINMAAGMEVFAENFDYGFFEEDKYVLTESNDYDAMARWRKLAGIQDD